MPFHHVLRIATAATIGVVLSGCQTDLSKLITNDPTSTASVSGPVPLAPKPRTNLPCRDASGDSPTGADWLAIYEACPASAKAAYNAGRVLFRQGKAERARAHVLQARDDHPTSEGLKKLMASFDNPFRELSNIANQQLANWLKRPSEVGNFMHRPTEKPKAPPLPQLVKDEYETTSEFQARVEKARQQRKQKLAQIERQYTATVARFNNAVKAHNAALSQEQNDRQRMAPEMRLRFMSLAMSQILGNPIIRELIYDADNSIFYGRLVSENRNFDKKITLKVPRDIARSVKAAERSLKSQLRFDVSEGELRLKGIDVAYQGQKFTGNFTDEDFQPVVMTASVENAAPSFTEIKTMQAETLNTASLLAGNDDYFKQALSFEDDPEMARLRQQQAEILRQKRELEKGKALKAQKEALLTSIQRQQKELDAMKGVATGFPVKPIAINYTKGGLNPDDVAVIIGNADYRKGKDIPNVTPAYADAEGFKRYVTEALGVREGNIIDIRDATSAQIVRVFGSPTNHKGQLFDWVKQGRSKVYVYYSGHGAPAGEDGSAFIVPSDADAARIDLNGYSLATLYRNLGKLPAKSVTVVLEACFSGSSQGGTVISKASPIQIQPKETMVPSNITVIAAGAADQIASWEQDSSSGLFTKYFLKGMSGEADAKPNGNGDGKVAYDELDRYLQATLTYNARRYYGREQTAQIIVGK